MSRSLTCSWEVLVHHRPEHCRVTCADRCFAQKTDGGTPNGSLRSSQVSQNPFLTSLPGRGNGQTLVTMGAPSC